MQKSKSGFQKRKDNKRRLENTEKEATNAKKVYSAWFKGAAPANLPPTASIGDDASNANVPDIPIQDTESLSADVTTLPQAEASLEPEPSTVNAPQPEATPSTSLASDATQTEANVIPEQPCTATLCTAGAGPEESAELAPETSTSDSHGNVNVIAIDYFDPALWPDVMSQVIAQFTAAKVRRAQL